jgi:superfamily II DNA helicase RecQ
LKINNSTSIEDAITLVPDHNIQQKIFEVQTFCSTKYFCRQQLIAKHYAWDGDSTPETCGKCDNCVSCIEDNVQELPNAVDDVLEMMETVKCLTAHHENVTPKDVVDVFTHAKTIDMESKGYISSEAYKRTYVRKVLVSKDLALQALNDLIVCGLVKQVCELKRQKERQMTCNTYIRGVVDNAVQSVRNRSWVYLAPCRQKRSKTSKQ